ncbi:MAG: hypothetical protein WA885_21390 [Phormidesmis sp.]
MGSGGGWHRVILLRLSQPIKGIRPALLSEDSLELMNKLRNFRHMVRHAYGAEIDLPQLEPNLTFAQKLYDLIRRDVDVFIAQLEAS